MPDVLPTSQSIPYLPRSRPYHLCHCMYLIVTHPISNSRPSVAETSRAMLSHRRHAASRPRNLGQRTQRSALAHLRRDTSRQASQHTKARPFSAPSKRSLIPPAKTPLSPNQRAASQRSLPTARARLALRLGIRVLRAVFFLLRAPRSPTSRNSDASEA
jgi:hypothetical protein